MFFNNLQLKTALPTWGIYVPGRIKKLLATVAVHDLSDVSWSPGWFVHHPKKKQKQRTSSKISGNFLKKLDGFHYIIQLFFEEFLIFCGNSTNKPKTTKNLSPGF